MSLNKGRAVRRVTAEDVGRPDAWDVKAASVFLGTSQDYVYRMASEGGFPPGVAFKFANRWRFNPEALRGWYSKQASGPQLVQS